MASKTTKNTAAPQDMAETAPPAAQTVDTSAMTGTVENVDLAAEHAGTTPDPGRPDPNVFYAVNAGFMEWFQSWQEDAGATPENSMFIWEVGDIERLPKDRPVRFLRAKGFRRCPQQAEIMEVMKARPNTTIG